MAFTMYLFLAQLMNGIHQRNRMIDIRLWQNTMAQIENVPWSTGSL